MSVEVYVPPAASLCVPGTASVTTEGIEVAASSVASTLRYTGSLIPVPSVTVTNLELSTLPVVSLTVTVSNPVVSLIEYT